MLPDIPHSTHLEFLRRALLVRRFEEALIILARSHQVGHFHVYIGQEITGVIALSLLEPGDLSFTTHRNHGHLLARGAQPGPMLAEILGKETGYCRGRGGTLHLASLRHGFPTTSSAVGGCLPLATGAAFAMQRLALDQISVCVFGDGALEEGAWHESANIAALERLPVIYLCENNSLEALGQKAGEYPSSSLAALHLTDLAEALRIHAVSVDGADAAAVYHAMKEAVRRARQGSGPSFIETRTVRWPGNRPLWPELLTGETTLSVAWDEHAAPSQFRAWHLTDDGLLRFVRELLAARVMDPESVLAIDKEVMQQVSAAVRFALESDYPVPETAADFVFAQAGTGR
jgi:pyruvate dehydrogenase E1 component alpha subunit